MNMYRMIGGPEKKQCKKGMHLVPITEFYRQNGSKDGLDSYCKACRQQYSMEYTKNNPDKKRAIQKRYYANHKETLKQRRIDKAGASE